MSFELPKGEREREIAPKIGENMNIKWGRALAMMSTGMPLTCKELEALPRAYSTVDDGKRETD